MPITSHSKRSIAPSGASETVLDYTYSDLPDDEIAVHKARVATEKALEREQEHLRMERARRFKFSGGMC